MKILIALRCLSLAGSVHAAQDDATLVAARASTLAARIGEAHPRLLLRPADLPALRDFLQAQSARADGAALAALAVPAAESAFLRKAIRHANTTR